ncbi:hypothetical protein BME24068_06482 [Burkholderia metallica]|nr:hypothetical protein BME24068_06482 [Burkholderia metallica]
MSSAELVIVAAIDVYVMPAPTTFSVAPSGSPTPVASSTPPMPSSTIPPISMPRLTLVPVSVFIRLSKPLSWCAARDVICSVPLSLWPVAMSTVPSDDSSLLSM